MDREGPAKTAREERPHGRENKVTHGRAGGTRFTDKRKMNDGPHAQRRVTQADRV
jgi:hypothetical protein